MTAPVLVCTVGGSPSPILTAIATCKPAHVVFIATVDLPGAEGRIQPGSISKLEGEGGIPARSGLAPVAFETIIVPPDHPDAAFATITEALRAVRARFPAAPLVADYTGGTKSMSAALLAAALAIPGVRLQIMAGTRSDLVRVADGTERPFPIMPDFLLIERQASLLSAAWKSFGYAEAADGFTELRQQLAARSDAPPSLVCRIADLELLSAAFAAWDRFDHALARAILKRLPAGHADWLAAWQADLDALLSPAPTPHLLRDLWRNAERRAARGQYDDAVARCYRLIEWTGQWLLRSRHSIDTGDVHWAELSSEDLAAAGISPRTGQKDLGGLVATLRFLAVLEPGGPMDRFLEDFVPGKKKRPGLNELRNMLDLRNPSILAHGQRPLARADWDRFRAFMTTAFFPAVLHPELIAAGVATEPPQLPPAPPTEL